MENSKVEEYWKRFKSEINVDSNNYDAWQFGFDADLLGGLVVERKKTATASAQVFYGIEQEDPPILAAQEGLLLNLIFQDSRYLQINSSSIPR